MGTIKDRNGKDKKEEEDINKKWQEYTENCMKKSLNDLDNHDGVVTHRGQTCWNVKSGGP